jgi:poly-gamma-glutamate capsule biosynthesis protein CapA/YwtB (metallophosphatase superfamily)
LLLLVSLLAFLFFKNIFILNEEIDSLYFQRALNQLLPPEKKLASLVFVGDIMLDRGVEWQIEKNGNNDFRFPFLKIAEELQKADILFGNLEGPISDKGQKVGSIYSFRMEPQALDGLTFAGFDVLSLANNHILDYTRLAMEDTFSRLREADIYYVGAGLNETEAYSPLIKDINGTKIAFLAFTNLGPASWEAKENRSGMALVGKERLEDAIKNAKSKSDLVVVSFHFGDEYKSSPTEEQKTIAQLAIDSGADLVVGHHPHVIEPVEEYKGKYIAYSLGNLVFDQSFSEETMKGLILKVIVENGEIKKVIPVEFKINQYFQPETPELQND